jgi:hypothetical protein
VANEPLGIVPEVVLHGLGGPGVPRDWRDGSFGAERGETVQDTGLVEPAAHEVNVAHVRVPR